ncbi:hypothetical protein [Kitasatospora sp. NPDC004289]
MLNAPIIIPTPVHTPSNSGDIPNSYAIAYIAAAFLVWIGVAVFAARHTDQQGKPTTDTIEAVLIGAGACILWPVSAVALGIWWVAKRATRPKTTAEKTGPRTAQPGTYMACAGCTQPVHPGRPCPR